MAAFAVLSRILILLLVKNIPAHSSYKNGQEKEGTEKLEKTKRKCHFGEPILMNCEILRIPSFASWDANAPTAMNFRLNCGQMVVF
jgi:hypothetical protein